MIRTARSLGSKGLVFALCGLFAGGCAGLGGPGRRIPEAQRLAYAAALAPQPGDLAASAEALEAFLVEFPDSLLGDDALEELARIEFLEGGREAAFARLREAVTRFPQGDRSDSIRLRLGLWESERQEDPAAREWLAGVRPERLSLAERRFFYRLRAGLAVSEVERLIDLSKLRAVTAEALAEKAGDAATTSE